MTVLELQELEEIKGLLTKGRLTGVLTYADVVGAVSEIDLDEAEIEELGLVRAAEKFDHGI